MIRKTASKTKTRIFIELGNFISNTYSLLKLKKKVCRYKKREKGVFIYAPNHPSTIDPFHLMGTIRQPFYILITEKAFKVPFIGFFLRNSKHIEVSEHNGRTALDKAIQYLNDKKSIMIFPEGMVTKDGHRIDKVRTGVIRMAMSTNIPVIPVGVYIEKDKIKEKYSKVGGNIETVFWYLNGRYVVNVGSPVYFTGDVNDWNLVRLNCEILKEKINEQIEKSMLESNIMAEKLSKLRRARNYVFNSALANTVRQVIFFIYINKIFF